MNYNNVYLKDLYIILNSIQNLDILNSAKILVTGATGLIGSAIVDFLMNCNDILNYEVKIYVAARNIEKVKERFGERIDRNDFHFVKYDALSDIDFNVNVDYIIHTASPAHPMEYSLHPVETILTNVYGANNILKYAKDHNVKRVLLLSSSEIYGINNINKEYKENDYGYVDILNSRSCYPSSKRLVETLSASYYKEYKVDSVIVRPGHVYGPTSTKEDSRASNQFFMDAINGKNIVMKSDGAQIRSYCYVLDCVSAIFTALINGICCEAYNISNPDSVCSIKELAECIVKEAKVNLIFENPNDIEKAGYNLMNNSSLDSKKLIEIGWKPLFSLSHGVKNTFNVMKNA